MAALHAPRCMQPVSSRSCLLLLCFQLFSFLLYLTFSVLFNSYLLSFDFNCILFESLLYFISIFIHLYRLFPFLLCTEHWNENNFPPWINKVFWIWIWICNFCDAKPVIVSWQLLKKKFKITFSQFSSLFITFVTYVCTYISMIKLRLHVYNLKSRRVILLNS